MSKAIEDKKAGSNGQPYVVLARKYRPETFDDLIGQQAMVQTLSNAFSSDRIAQGYMLTGVRGVGKTTTARILARALNYSKPGIDGPTVHMDGYGENCQEIIKGRHPDVLEMDAASNTGIDNIREIIESARYKPLIARYKVYIIDEVHMLSKGAFNALLKTLEEPPEHVKFIFATTEVRKVPVTVLSRCQRFDLRRVGVADLVAHFERIAANEGATADKEALTLIARAAEGSVRDGLSILDQAIAMGSGSVTTEAVRAMLGLADRGRIYDLLEDLFSGGSAAALKGLTELYADSAEPAQVLADLAEAVHAASRIKVAGEEAAGEAVSGEERRRAAALAERLSVPLLARAWQMLLKGLDEVARAPNPLAAAEMVLIRIAHTADLPTPEELMRMIGDQPARPPELSNKSPAIPRAATNPSAPVRTSSIGGTELTGNRALKPRSPGPEAAVGSSPRLETFADVVELVGHHRDARLKIELEEYFRLVSFEQGRIEVELLGGATKNVVNELSEKLSRWTGQRWFVTIGRQGSGAETIGEVRRAREATELSEVRDNPAVQALLAAFPDAQVKSVRPIAGMPDAFPITGEEESDDESELQ